MSEPHLSDGAYLRHNPRMYLHLKTLFAYIHHIMTDRQQVTQTFAWDQDCRDAQSRAILVRFARAGGVHTVESDGGFTVSRPS